MSCAAWVFLPALGAPLAHAPVLRWDHAPALARPISRPLFGENKTWRGAFFMTARSVSAALALRRLPSYRERLTEPVAAANPVIVGALLGIASWTGELPNSFQEASSRNSARRAAPLAHWGSHLGPRPGGLGSGSVGVAAAYLANERVRGCQTFVSVAAVHVPINLVGFAIGARTAPL